MRESGAMAYAATGSVIRQIGALFDGSFVAGLGDRQLLERFIARPDAAGEAAFAALVARHGPMVLHVCRQILGDLHHAEDTFQAVFLVLARRARSIRDPDLLGNWLYGVAIRTARCAKLRIHRQRKNEEEGAMRRPGSGSNTVSEQPALALEDVEALHDEIARLPGSFRLPVVLCYFEGLTLDEAAHRLRWPAGTVRSRLARARDKLRRGLTHRGVALPAAVLATALSTRSASAHISSPLCDATTKAAISFAAGQAACEVVSASVAALAQEVIRAMLISKLKFVVLTFLALGAIATGVGALTHSLAMKDEPQQSPATQRPQPVATPVVADQKLAVGRMFVVGRVLDPAGKPVAGAIVDIMGRARKPWVAARKDMETRLVLGQGTTNGGYFRLEAPRTSADGFFEVYALAMAPGFALGWVKLNADAQRPTADIRLRPEQMIQGRLFDVHGQPAGGVELRVSSLGIPSNIGTFDGVNVGNDGPPEGVCNWPKPVTTDNQGRFTLTGIGRALLFLSTLTTPDSPARALASRSMIDRHPNTSRWLSSQPRSSKDAFWPEIQASRCQCAVQVGSSQEPFSSGGGPRVRTSNQGQFTANVRPGKYYKVQAVPPTGQPYLIHTEQFEWTKGVVKKVIDVKLPRGVLIQGKVTEQGSSRALADANVQYYPVGNRDDGLVSGWNAVVASKDDGSFQIAVPPGKGHVFVFGPTSDFILEEIGSRMLYNGRMGGERYYAHDIIAYELKAGDPPHELTAVLRPGKKVRGRVVGPDGQTVEDVAIITRLHIQPFNPFWRGDFQLHTRDGEFELRGLDPEKTAPVYFLDADHQWGTTVEFSGKQAGENMTVRLQPCGQAKARLVNPDGKPIAGIFPHFEILGTPGPDGRTKDKKEQAMLAADSSYMANVDRKHYWRGPRTDAGGRITLLSLIPGALYRITDNSNQDKGYLVRKDFTVKPGEMLDLGDILIEKPQQ